MQSSYMYKIKGKMRRLPTTSVHHLFCFLLVILLLFIAMAAENQNFQSQIEDNTASQQLSDGVDAENEQGVVQVTESSKTAWPEVVGLTVEEAEKRIKEDMPDAHFQVVPKDAFVTMEYNQGRVRLFVDSSDMVARTPIIG